MKKLVLLFAVLFTLTAVQAQVTDSTGQPNNLAARHKIAIFTPLYLDSAFDASNEYRFSKNIFPKYINPGLEFYEGAQLAIDSLAKTNAPLEVFVYDTRSSTESTEEQLRNAEQNGVELILAYCSSNDVRAFADAGLKRNIPVINVNLPNEGSATGNPFFVLLNPTLKTQCEGMYAYIRKYFSLDNIIFFTKKGQLEERIQAYFEEFGKTTTGVPLKIKYVELTDSFTVNQLKTHLKDTLQTALCIAGSMNDDFGKRLANQLALLKKQKYKPVVMGMPTWEGFSRDFSKAEYKGLEIIYSNPFYNDRKDKVSQGIVNYFNTVMFARPSDMVMRGYEALWHFANLLLQYKADIASNITRKEFYSFSREFNIQPVLNRQNMMLDYFENKRLYFVKWLDGILKAAN